MRPINKTEDLVKNASFKAGPDLDACLWSEITKAQKETTQTGFTLRVDRKLRVISKYVAMAGVAAILVFGVMYFGGLTYKTSRVYAAAMDALQTVRSVHISGWTTKPGYGKSLETMDLNQRYPMEICEWVTDAN
jgi:hypothetical protein